MLGPLLFLIYINDIADSLEGSALLFADDTSISYFSPDIQYLPLKSNADLQKLHIWACKCLIIFNPIKNEVMLVSNTFIGFNLQLIMDNTILQIVDAHRHLGVILTSNNTDQPKKKALFFRVHSANKNAQTRTFAEKTPRDFA